MTPVGSKKLPTPYTTVSSNKKVSHRARIAARAFALLFSEFIEHYQSPILTQILPFAEAKVLSLLEQCETAMYAPRVSLIAVRAPTTECPRRRSGSGSRWYRRSP